MKGIFTAIEFGSSKIACLSGAKAMFGKYQLLAEAVCPYAGFRRKAWLQPDAVGCATSETIRRAESALGKNISEVYIGVPGEFTKVVCQDSELDWLGRARRVNAEHMAELISKTEEYDKPEDYELLGTYPAYYLIDKQKMVLDPLGMSAKHILCRASHVHAEKEFIRHIDEIFGSMNIAVSGLVCVPLAQTKMLIPPSKTGSICILVDVGYYITDVSVVLGEAILYHTTLQIGGYHLANDLSLCLDMPLEEAEQLKRSMTLDAHPGKISAGSHEDGENVFASLEEGGSAQDILYARMDEICRLIGQAIERSGTKYGEDTPVYLTGGGVSMMNRVEDYMRSALNLDVEIAAYTDHRRDSCCLSGVFGVLDFSFGLEESKKKHGGNIASFTF